MNSQERTRLLRQRASELIPAGAHTYSRADDQFPSCAPAFVSRARGCRFWDENEREYIDYGMGLLSVSIGHANEEINARVIEAIHRGTSYSRPSLLEGEMAERLNALIPSAQMVKYAKNGSDVTSAAIRLARHYTGRKYIVRCNQQPFLSFNDWFIVSTSRSGGIPPEMREWMLRFDYNDVAGLQEVFGRHGRDIACVIMEPFTNELPAPGFLEAVKAVCEEHGALLVFDEMITGARVDIGGAQRLYGVTPHLSTFGKGIANGYPFAVLCGQKDIMQHGGMDREVFLLSCTFGGETVGLTAAMATLEFMEKYEALRSIAAYGQKLIRVFNECIVANGLEEYMTVTGHPARPEMRFYEGRVYSFPLKTLFMQEMMRQGIFMERISISYAHGDAESQVTEQALEKALQVMAEAIATETVRETINGSIARPVFTS